MGTTITYSDLDYTFPNQCIIININGLFNQIVNKNMIPHNKNLNIKDDDIRQLHTENLCNRIIFIFYTYCFNSAKYSTIKLTKVVNLAGKKRLCR